MMRVGLGRDAFYLGDRNHRQEADEQKETGKEKPERADVSADINRAGPIVAPARRQEIAMERNDDDDESLEPHADIDEDGNDKHRDEDLAEPLEPKKLGDGDVA